MALGRPISENKRLRVYAKHKGKCAHCGIETEPIYEGYAPNNAVIDHIIPKSRGGSNDEENLQLLCWTCNSKKGTKTMEEFIIHIGKGEEVDRILSEWSEEIPQFSETVKMFNKYLPLEHRYAFVKPIHNYIKNLKEDE